MTRHIVRHFAAEDIKFTVNGAEVTIPNKYRHLDLKKAEEMAVKFRQHLIAGGISDTDIKLRGHSAAFRTKYSLLLGTVGIANGTPVVEIPELSIGSDPDSLLMIEGFKAHGVKVWEYSPEQIAACDRIGARGAEPIKAAEAGITDGETIWFTHAPISAFFALHLAGNPAGARERLLRLPSNEGDRLVVEGDKITLVPLG